MAADDYSMHGHQEGRLNEFHGKGVKITCYGPVVTLSGKLSAKTSSMKI